MEFPQTYETTIVNPGTELAPHFFIIPKRSWEDEAKFSNVNLDNILATMKELGLKPHCTISAVRIAHGLTAVLTIDGVHDDRIDNLNQLVVENAGVYSFAVKVANRPLIPFERSPLTSEALADILKNSGMTVGAALGFYAGVGDPLLLFILVPAGIIICGAAKGIADALQEGLRDKILKSLKSKRKK